VYRASAPTIRAESMRQTASTARRAVAAASPGDAFDTINHP
jgi:hypothetical protein